MFQDVRNSGTSMTITIGVAGMRHFIIGFFIFQQFFKIAVDGFFVGADQPERSSGHPLRAFGRIPHNQNGNSIRGTFLLDAAGISQT